MLIICFTFSYGINTFIPYLPNALMIYIITKLVFLILVGAYVAIPRHAWLCLIKFNRVLIISAVNAIKDDIQEITYLFKVSKVIINYYIKNPHLIHLLFNKFRYYYYLYCLIIQFIFFLVIFVSLLPFFFNYFCVFLNYLCVDVLNLTTYFFTVKSIIINMDFYES